MKIVAGVLTFFIVIVMLSSCGGTSEASGSTENDSVYLEKSDTIRIANDSLEYEVIIIEPGFNSWLATQPPRGYRSQSSMDIINDFKIPLYNLRVNQPLQYDPNLYPFRIDYDTSVDYGYEVTYLLFNYFKFFEERFNQRL
ncbi:hypothetical protein [Nonlabens agnitus]|uniref:Uncharacterized protein n=1 Tax=Nonlabens agnitus TaxID=870484 RepID=A0A2S9WTP9_9FLAO|nr:hypothetical protein [Nonlabens agnitus]PRP66686.1 hypothetical protein BST86_06010 [Nonlabens agnitus]